MAGALVGAVEEELSRAPDLVAVLTANLSPLVSAKIYAGAVKFCVEAPPRLSVQSAKTFGELEALSEGLWGPSSGVGRRVCVLGAILHALLTLRSAFVPSGFVQDYHFGRADVEAQARVFRARLGRFEGKTLVNPNSSDLRGLREYLKRVCYGNKVVFDQDRAALDALVECVFAD